MNSNYNKFSEKYDALYLENIREFQKKMRDGKVVDEYYVDFYPSFGIKESEKTDFIIYGQAVNGWGSGFNLFDQVDVEKLHHSILCSNRYLSSKNHTPLDWVNVQWTASGHKEHNEDPEIAKYYSETYRPYRSLFWNVVYKLISDYHGLERGGFDWSSKMVWSNLYKIALEDSNPDVNCRAMQQPLSAELVKQEIAELKPKYCVVLTNLEWWLPFREILQTDLLPVDKAMDEIVSAEKYGDTTIIVTNRPFTGNADKFVEQILQLIKSQK